MVINIVDTTEDHVKLLKTVFDFAALRALFARPDFSFVYDSMHGVQVRAPHPSDSDKTHKGGPALTPRTRHGLFALGTPLSHEFLP